MDVDEFGFWDKIKYVFSDPETLFEKTKAEEGIGNAMILYLIIASVMGIVGTSFSAILLGVSPIVFAFAVTYPFIGLLFAFFVAGFIHLIVLMWHGDRTYANTFNVYVYSSIPVLILSYIPVVGSVSIIYTIVLNIIGLSKVHDISKVQASVSVLVPIFILLALLMVAMYYLFVRVLYF